jgi:hypothetical protein
MSSQEDFVIVVIAADGRFVVACERVDLRTEHL